MTFQNKSFPLTPEMETLKATYLKAKEECGDLIVDIFATNLDNKMNKELIAMFGQLCAAVDHTTDGPGDIKLWQLAIDVVVKFKPVLERELKQAKLKIGDTNASISKCRLSNSEVEEFIKLLRDPSSQEQVDSLCQTHGPTGSDYKLLRILFQGETE